MSLLKHYTHDKVSNNEGTALMVAPENSIDVVDTRDSLQLENDLINITVEDLNTIVNLPPNSDPFIVYLYTYIQNLTFLLDRIYEIKKAEKSLKLRLKQAEKLLNSLLSTTVEVPLDDAVAVNENNVVITDSEVTPSSTQRPPLKMVQNLQDFN